MLVVGSMDTGATEILHNPVMILVPDRRIILGRVLVKIEKFRTAVGGIARPQKLPVAGPQDVETGGEAISEVVVGIVRSRVGEAIFGDDPIAAPVAAARNASGEMPKHVEGVTRQPQRRRPGTLMRHVPHAEYTAAAVRPRCIPVARRVAGIST